MDPPVLRYGQAHDQILVRRLPASADDRWQTAEQAISGTSGTVQQAADRIIKATLRHDFNYSATGSWWQRLWRTEPPRSPEVHTALLTVLEVRIPQSRPWDASLSHTFTSLIQRHRGRAYLLIRNFPATAVSRRGWASVDAHCTDRNLSSANLCVSDGRNPECFAGTSALNLKQSWMWDGPHDEVGHSLSAYCALVRRGTAPTTQHREMIAGRLALFDYRPQKLCPGLLRDIDSPLFDRTFATPGFKRGQAFPHVS